MKDFPSLKGKLDNSTILKIKDHFKTTIFNYGTCIMHETPTGGIHYTGTLTKRPSLSFEIVRSKIYIMITLNEYVKGIVFHVHIYYPHIDKIDETLLKNTVTRVYDEVKKVVE